MSRMAHSTPANSKLPLGLSWTTLQYEESFDVPKSIQFLHDYAHIPFIIAIGVYLPMIYFGQKIMANREPIKAKRILVLWNFSLAVFSTIGFLRVSPELFHTFKNFGFEQTICNNSYSSVKPAAFWTYLFALSKIPELADTLFLVLRKQKLIFLHVFHHATVPIFAWFMYADQMAAARWFCTMNFGVHSIMYAYYALKAFPNLIWIPKWVSMQITTLQILQMITGNFVVLSAAYMQLNGKSCDTTTRVSIAALMIYISNLVLFSHFFYKTYCCSAPPRLAKDNKKRV